MKRRNFLTASLALAASTSVHAQATAPACATPLPTDLARHDLVTAAWRGLDATRVWDAHAHVVGVGDLTTGTYVNPASNSWWSPIERARRLMIMSAACVEDGDPAAVDAAYVARLLDYANAMPVGYRLMLFAFDFVCDDQGRELRDQSTFAVPNEYPAALATRFADRLQWVASIHPYRPDAVERLSQAATRGARAVKWLPSSMNIDPSSPKCDAFFAALVRHQLPLITHGGEEKAAPGARQESFNNPLHLRRALDAGVNVVFAHCASLGHAIDLDRGANAQPVPAFDLFARLMDNAAYGTHLRGDVSAVFQRNRTIEVQRAVLKRSDWHARLLHGSDYPLPGLSLLYRLDALVESKLLPADAVPVLEAIRRHNPLLFEFALKRTLAADGQRFADSVFHTRDFFDRRGN